METNIKTKKCVHCKEDINVECSRCPNCTGKNYVWTTGRKIVLGVIIVMFLPAFFAIISPSKTDVPADVVDFGSLARSRFEEIKNGFTELKEIKCDNDRCDGIVYFNFSKMPEDFDFVVRGNTVTFSNFKDKSIGISKVTIVAQLNGKTKLTCTASNRKIEHCE